jgi:hypothetical protein
MPDSNLPQQSGNLKPPVTITPTHNFITIKGKFTFKPEKEKFAWAVNNFAMTKKGFYEHNRRRKRATLRNDWREEKVALLLVINRTTRRLSYFITFLPLLYVFWCCSSSLFYLFSVLHGCLEILEGIKKPAIAAAHTMTFSTRNSQTVKYSWNSFFPFRSRNKSKIKNASPKHRLLRKSIHLSSSQCIMLRGEPEERNRSRRLHSSPCVFPLRLTIKYKIR